MSSISWRSGIRLEGHLFFGRVDLDRIGAFGHSAGAMIVSRIPRMDKRVKAIVLLDGGVRPEDGTAVPALILRSEHVDLDRRFPDVAKESARTRSEFLRKAKPGIQMTAARCGTRELHGPGGDPGFRPPR